MVETYYEIIGNDEPIKTFKSISNHVWGTDDKKYNEVMTYLISNQVPEFNEYKHNLKNYKKKKYNFKKFSNQYKLNETGQLYITRLDIDENLKKSLLIHKEKRYYVVRPSKKDDIIRNIVSGNYTAHTSLSATYIYNRILHNENIINISLEYIKIYLNKREHHIKAMRKNDKKQAKS